MTRNKLRNKTKNLASSKTTNSWMLRVLVSIVQVAVISSLFMLLPFVSQAQSSIEKKGQKAFEKYRYTDAIKFFSKSKYLTPKGMQGLAASYRFMDQLDSAEVYYRKLIKTGFHKTNDIYVLADVLRSQGKYLESFEWMAVFSEKNPHDSRVMRQLMDPEYFMRIAYDTGSYDVHALNVNTEAYEFGPTVVGESLVFASSRENSVKQLGPKHSNRSSVPRLYTGKINSTGGCQRVDELSGPFDSKGYYGAIAYNASADEMVFAGLDDKSENQNTQLYVSTKHDGEWSLPEGMWFNHHSYFVGQPTLSKDGSSLIFASDMPGGFGGSDLYLVKKRNDGGWGFPINLGKEVNTEGDEVFPTYLEDDGLVFFASDGHPGLGGLDILVGALDGNHLQNVRNVGIPFNSSRDDFGLNPNTDRTQGYFVSNREGGAGKDDLYYYEAQLGPDSLPVSDRLNVLENGPGYFEYAQGHGNLKGKFVHRQIAQDSVILNLYNEEGDRIGQATTNAEGKFIFKGLNFYDSYVIKLENDSNGLFDQSVLYFLNQEGGMVDSARTLLFNAYSFQYLPKEYSVRPILEEIDQSALSVVGQFYYKGLSRGRMKLEIMGELDLRDTVFTDELGLFKFENLSANRQYMVRVIDNDTVEMEYAEIEFIGFDSSVVGFAEQQTDSTFQFVATRSLAYDEALSYKGKRSQMIGRFVVDDVGMDSVVISIFDREGNYISTTTTDSTGEFVFNDLEYFKAYKLRLAEAYSELFQNSKIYLLDEDRQAFDTAAVYRFNEYSFTHLPPDVVIPLTLLDEIDESLSLAGYFSDGAFPQEGVRLALRGNNPAQETTTLTMVNGEFEFDELSPNTDYELSISEVHRKELDSARVYLLSEENPDGVEVHLNRKKVTLNSSRFGIRKSVNSTGDEALITMSGVFSPGKEKKDGVSLLVFNDRGVLIDTVTTDERGEFQLNRVEYHRPYILKLGRSFVHLFEDADICAIATRLHARDTASKKNFNEYRIILDPPFHIPEIERLSEVDAPFDLRSAAEGQLKFEKFPTSKIECLLIDQDGVTIDRIEITRSGRFEFTQLKGGQAYFLKLEKKDTSLLRNAVWNLWDRDSKQTLKTWRVGMDIIAFKAPNIWVDPSSLNSAMGKSSKATRIVHPNLRPIYFGLGKSTIRQAELTELDRVVKFLLDYPSLGIEIRSYTDSQGSSEDNLQLSRDRSDAAIEYIMQKGISSERVKGEGYGEQNILNSCIDGVECVDEDHAVNRRAEFYILD